MHFHHTRWGYDSPIFWLKEMTEQPITRTKAWLESLRPKTLPLAFSAIIVGTALAWQQGHFDPLVALLALITAGLLQILSISPMIMATPSKAAINLTVSGRCAECKKAPSPSRR